VLLHDYKRDVLEPTLKMLIFPSKTRKTETAKK
jgi:hypothetical protein